LALISSRSILTSNSSYQRAEKAQKQGWFDHEIVPVEGFVKDPNTGVRSRVMITEDDGIRYGTTPESLSKIRPAFPQWGGGKTTGGNASQITDGAAAILLMTRRKAEELNLKIIAKYVTTAISGPVFCFLHYWIDRFELCCRSGSANHGHRAYLCYTQGSRAHRDFY
jgi:Thiolase, N-terminal domain